MKKALLIGVLAFASLLASAQTPSEASVEAHVAAATRALNVMEECALAQKDRYLLLP
jgi:hypothetical protein